MGILDFTRGFVDQLNPLSERNVTLFFIWLNVYFFTAMTIWRAEKRWVRLLSLIVNQLFSAGLLVSYLNIVVPAAVYWKEAAANVLLVVSMTWLMFWLVGRKRKRKRLAQQRQDDRDDLHPAEIEDMSRSWLAQEERQPVPQPLPAHRQFPRRPPE